MTDTSAYRNDIDGLRALAVLLVVLFHLHVPGVSGGYVGVDVFFVISGFVVTRSIWPKMSAGSFSFRAFYLRRFWRLQPSFFLVVTATLVASSFVLAGVDLQRAAASALASAALSANFFFWLTTTGYDGVDAQLEPFLQMWSLAVEEQFYLVWPCLLLLIARVPALRRPPLGVAALCAALVLSEWLARSTIGFGYYLLPARIVELGLGAFLVRTESWVPSPKFAFAGTVVGITSVLAAAMQLEVTSRFPGLNAVIPCLGTALLIQCGSVDTPPRLLFTNAVSRFVGRASYGWYLWHWPAIALASYAGLSFDPALQLTLGLGSFVVAALSYRFWETPTRRSPKRVWRYATAACAATAATTIAFPLIRPLEIATTTSGAPSITGSLMAGLELDHHLAFSCLFKAIDFHELDICGGIKSQQDKRLLIWGDSHARGYDQLIRRYAERLGWTPTTIRHPGCPPLFGVRTKGTTDYARYCQGQIAEQVDRLLDRHEFDAILLTARFGLYEVGTDPRRQFQSGHFLLSDDHTTGNDSATSALVLRRHLISTVRYLREHHDIPVIFAIPHPDMPKDPSRDRNKTMAVPRHLYAKGRKLVVDAIAQFPSDIIVIDPIDVICGETQCPAWQGTVPLYEDLTHLNASGADRLLPLLEQALANVSGD